jgi:hypothetical protein
MMRSKLTDAVQTLFTIGWISVGMLIAKFYFDLH